MAKARKARPRIESRVRLYRVARGWSQTTLAGLARVALPAVTRAERGDVLGASVETLLRIANALEATVAEVWPLLGPKYGGMQTERDRLVAERIREVDEAAALREAARPCRQEWTRGEAASDRA